MKLGPGYRLSNLSYIFRVMQIRTSLQIRPAVSAAEAVAEDLAAQIMRDVSIGGQLPSEAELAARFEVSRVTVREALKILSGRGLVQLARGRRAMVTQPDGAVFGAFLGSLLRSDPRTMLDLLEVRRTLEVEAVTLACRTASRSGLAAVEAARGAGSPAPRHKDAGGGGAGAAWAPAPGPVDHGVAR
ncbi:MAG: FadR family transcriptional regulator, partial [Rubellimicrobium sp.]|nr:FadR family transcriptional regulator [Rubellimicrobium sp.]